MAKSGVIKGSYSGNKNVWLSLEWELKSQSESSNKSVIHVELWIRGKDSYRHWNFTPNTKYIIVDGNKKTDTSTSFDTNKNPCKIMSKDFTITHDSDGTCSFKIAARHYSEVKLGTATISGTSHDLPKINRVSTLGTTTFYQDEDGYPKAVKSTYTKYNSAYTQVLHIQIGSWKKTVNNYKSGEKILFTSTEISAIKNSIGKTFTVTVYISTYKGSTHIGDSAKWSHIYTLPSDSSGNMKIYIKVDSNTIKRVKGVYVKPTSSLISKAKGVYVKPSSSLISKC